MIICVYYIYFIFLESADKGEKSPIPGVTLDCTQIYMRISGLPVTFTCTGVTQSDSQSAVTCASTGVTQ